MLVTTLDHAAGNDYLAARFQKAYAFLNRDDLGSLPLGRVDIDGDAVFANVQEYDTVPAEEKQLEAHRRYYDVQFVVSGEEVMQYAPLEGLAKVQPFDEDADFGLYCTPERPSSIVLRAGDVAVLAPEDAHKPGCALDAPCCVRKIVVKVLVWRAWIPGQKTIRRSTCTCSNAPTAHGTRATPWTSPNAFARITPERARSTRAAAFPCACSRRRLTRRSTRP